MGLVSRLIYGLQNDAELYIIKMLKGNTEFKSLYKLFRGVVRLVRRDRDTACLLLREAFRHSNVYDINSTANDNGRRYDSVYLTEAIRAQIVIAAISFAIDTFALVDLREDLVYAGFCVRYARLSTNK